MKALVYISLFLLVLFLWVSCLFFTAGNHSVVAGAAASFLTIGVFFYGVTSVSEDWWIHFIVSMMTLIANGCRSTMLSFLNMRKDSCKNLSIWPCIISFRGLLISHWRTTSAIISTLASMTMQWCTIICGSTIVDMLDNCGSLRCMEGNIICGTFLQENKNMKN